MDIIIGIVGIEKQQAGEKYNIQPNDRFHRRSIPQHFRFPETGMCIPPSFVPYPAMCASIQTLPYKATEWNLKRFLIKNNIYYNINRQSYKNAVFYHFLFCVIFKWMDPYRSSNLCCSPHSRSLITNDGGSRAFLVQICEHSGSFSADRTISLRKRKNAQRRLFLYIFLQALPTADGFVKRTLFALGISCRTEVAAKEDEQMVAFVPAAAVDLAAQLLFHL